MMSLRLRTAGRSLNFITNARQLGCAGAPCWVASRPPNEIAPTSFVKLDSPVYPFQAGAMEGDASQALAVLTWLRAMGVDETIGDAPLRWATGRSAAFEDADNASLDASPAPSLPTPPPVAIGDPSEPGARPLAKTAGSLEDLRGLLQTFEGCALRKTAKKLCLYRGSPSARIMLVGEAPGKEEDTQGIPFVGPAGQLLDRMLASIGLTGEDVFITNLVFWKPPGNRTPSIEEVQACRPFLEREIELVRPAIIISLGGAAAKEITGVAESIGKLRGRWMPFQSTSPLNFEPKTTAIFHPAYLLRNPLAKRQAWRDLLSIRDALDRLR